MKIIQGDCLDAMKGIEPGSIDVVMADPPYGMDFQSNRSKTGPRHKKLKGDDKVDTRFLADAYRILADNGAIFVFCDWKTSYSWLSDIQSAGFNVKSQIIWDRDHHGMGDLRGAFAPQHDIIWYATKNRRTFVGKRPKSVLRHRRPSPSEDNGHPTCKPVDLIVDLLKPVAVGTVLDPFMGSGTTGVACKQLGIDFIGIEIDEEYADIALQRISAE